MTDLGCPANQTLADFLDEKLLSQQTSDVSRHIETCRRCQTFCDQLTEARHAPTRGDVARRSHPALGKVIQQLIQSGAGKSTGGRSSPKSGETVQNAEAQTSTNTGVKETNFPIAGDPTAPLGRLSNYAILDAVAEGNQGILYRARDESLNRIVAIKVIHQRLLQSNGTVDRFRREARLIASVKSDHVVQVFHAGQEPGFPPYIVMEFVDGDSLRHKLDRRDSIPIRRCVEIVRDTAVGLQAVHQAGMIHRDVKPSNILLDRKVDGRVRLTDFGLAVEEDDAVRMTQEGTILGTPAYMSPEQVTRPQSIDYRSDVYSLGVVLYELLTGEVPFRGTVRMTLSQLVHDDPRSPRQYNEAIPKDLETICLRAMSKDPAARFPSAQELVNELNRWLEGRPIHSRPTSRLERAWRWCRRNSVVSSLSALVITLLATLSIVMTVSSVRLRQANQTAELHATTAQEQSNASLETLGKLIFQLQKQFDHDEVDISELQRESLQIALAGLRKVRTSAQSSTPDLSTAEALRRLGELMLQLGEYSESSDCLKQAESILRRQLKTDPANHEAIGRLVETLWTLDNATSAIAAELNVEPMTEQPASALLKEASDLAQRRLTLNASPESQNMAAVALLKHGGDLVTCGQTTEAAAVLEDSLRILELLISNPQQATSATRRTWLEAADYRYLAMADPVQADSMELALQFLKSVISKADQFVLDDPEDGYLPVFRLELQDRLASHWALCAEHKPRKKRQAELKAADAATAEFVAMSDKLATLLREDEMASFDACAALQEVVDSRLAMEQEASAERFLRSIIRISEQRLEVARDDVDARGFVAESWSVIADLQAAAEDSNPEEVMACYQKSLEQYKTLRPSSWFDEIDFENYIDTATSAAEFAADFDLPESDTLFKEARQLLSEAIAANINLDPDWLNDTQQRLEKQ